MRWHLHLLGEFTATGQSPAGERLHVGRWATRKVGSLLAFLACHPDRSHPREELAERLWPEAEAPELGRQSLRSALNSLRRVLEPPGVLSGSVLRADRQSVRLAAGAVTTDVGEFLQALRSLSKPDRALTAAGEAVRLYTGPLLPGYYEDWVLAARDQLAERHLEALRIWVRGLRRAGDALGARDALRAAVATDPTREELHAELIGLLLSEGDRPGAVRQYQALERVLRETEGTQPGPTLAAMIRSAAEVPKAEPGSNPDAPSLAASSSPELPPPARTPDHLPLELRSFHGRSRELAHLRERIGPGTGCRLVTLTGPGGMGKTRLSLEAARSVREAYAGAAYFIPLAEISDGALLSDRLRSALGLTPDPGQDPLEQVARHLGERPALLVLDNLEQVVEAAAAWVGQLLTRLPAATLLTTTRTRLLLAGEEEVTLGPLALPGSTDVLAEVASTPSVQLFIHRARNARPDFQVTPSNLAQVVQIVHLLEGIPLALELVAARASVLTAAQMVAELGNRLETVATPRTDRPDRHRSLRAALEWSYRLLPPRLRLVFRRLSVFRGGWTLDAAAGIVVEGALLSPEDRRSEALDAMTQLRHHSLIHLDTASSAGLEPRYRMLETVREYAEEQLKAEERVPLARSHWEYFQALALQIHDGCRKEAHWFAVGDAETDNLRAALAATLSSEPLAGSRLAQCMLPYWNCRGRFQEGISWVERFLLTQQHSPLQQARLLGVAAMLGMDWGELQRSRAYSERALALARQLGDVDEQIQALDHLGCITFRLKEYHAAREHYLASLRLINPEADPHRLAWSLMYVGYCSVVLHDWDAAQEQLERCQEVGARSPDLPRELSARLQLANLALLRERYAEALRRFEACLADVAQTGMLQQRAVCLLGVANAATETGDLPRARALYLEALELVERLGMRNTLGDACYFLARLERVAGNSVEAEQYRARALEMAECLEGGGIALQLLLEFALVLAASHPETAARLLGLVRSMTGERHGEVTARQWRDLAFAQAQVALRLGDANAESLQNQGATLTPAQAFEEVRKHLSSP